MRSTDPPPAGDDRATSSVAPADSALAAVLLLELELQSPACRSDPERLAALLADDFTEIGASGRSWSKREIVQALAGETADTPPIEVHDLAGRLLAEDIALVHWISIRGDASAMRTSLWRRTGGGWRLVFHQGTPKQR